MKAMLRRAIALAALALLAVGGTANGSVAPLAVPRELKVMSYYPADAGWTKMWTDWRPERIAQDLRRVASLRANTVRAIVQPSVFGFPHPAPAYTSRLRRFVDLAAQAGLHVQLTLFDQWYAWSDLRGSRTWAKELLAPYLGDPRLAVVELRNELIVKPHTAAWARRMIPFVRSLMRGRTPVTISVAGPDPVASLRGLKRGLRPVAPDFFTIHLFGGGGETAASVFGHAKRVAAPVPLWVGETGYPTTTSHSGYGGMPRTPEAQEAAQAHFLASVGWATRRNALPAAGIWTLSDFEPSAGVPEAELRFGLFRVDGSEKPAARVVRAIFSGRVPIACNNGFEDGVPAEDGALVPARWSMTGAHVAFAQDATVARTGTASARLTPKMGEATGSLSITPPNGAVESGESVSLRAWARGASAVLVLEWFDRRGRVLGRNASESLGAGGWSPLEVTARAPARSAYLRVELVARRATGPVWFDDVSLRRTSSQ